MGKERSDGGVAALWMEKQIWEQTDAEEEQASSQAHLQIYLQCRKKQSTRRGRRKFRGGQDRSEMEREPHLAVAQELEGELSPARRGTDRSCRGRSRRQRSERREGNPIGLIGRLVRSSLSRPSPYTCSHSRASPIFPAKARESFPRGPLFPAWKQPMASDLAQGAALRA